MNGLLYDALTYPFERFALGKLREQIIRPLTGRVIDVGVGTGADFAHYNARAHIVALEPDARMLSRALHRRRASAAAIELIQDDDSYLDRLPAGCADAVVFALVLCTTSDPHHALVRARRVLKPSGTLAILEHVRSDGVLGFVQDRVAPFWSVLADGCALNRDTLQTIRAAGFDTAGIEQRHVPGGIIRDIILGCASLLP